MKRALLTGLLTLSISLFFTFETAAQRRLPNGTLITPRTRVLPVRTHKVCSEERRHDLLERVERATAILREFMDAQDHGLPQAMLDRANCIAVVPSMKKGGFGVGGQWGRGVMSCRYENRAWSPPAFFTVTGGSFGLQIGLQVTDLVMIISTRSGLNSLLQNRIEVGANAGATALLFGRNAGVSTDALLDSRIFSYARTRGLFAGLELRSAFFKTDETANCVLYGERYANGDLLHTHDILSRETMPNTRQGDRVADINVFSRALREISPAKVIYVKVPKSRLQPPPATAPAQPPAQPAQSPPAQTPPKPSGS